MNVRRSPQLVAIGAVMRPIVVLPLVIFGAAGAKVASAEVVAIVVLAPFVLGVVVAAFIPISVGTRRRENSGWIAIFGAAFVGAVFSTLDLSSVVILVVVAIVAAVLGYSTGIDLFSDRYQDS